MKGKTDEIVQKISKIRAFTEDSYLKTTHFVIFLLFGCSDEIKETLERRASEIIVDKNGIAFLSIDDTADVVESVREAHIAVAKSGVRLNNLTELHFCPLVVSDNAEPARFAQVVDSLEKYKDEKDWVTYWNPFILLEKESESAADWLAVISEKTKSLKNSCRCCALSHFDEGGFAVNLARLLDTALFTAMLNANNVMRGDLAERIAYNHRHPSDLYYTAQTVFISNPLVVRTLSCIQQLLERIESGSSNAGEINLSFARDVLQPLYEQLPQENGKISFAPLYGVMPQPEEDLFQKRLRDFIRTYYRAPFEHKKEEIFSRFRRGFLRAFIESGQSITTLQGIIGNANEIQRLSRSTTVVFPMSTTPQFTRKSGLSAEAIMMYANAEADLSRGLNNMGPGYLEEFFKSDAFTSLPDLYTEARKRIRSMSTTLRNEVDKRTQDGEEIVLKLSDDPDEKLILNASRDANVLSSLSQCVAEVIFAMEKQNEAGVEEALAKLFDSLYTAIVGLSGRSSAEEYMRQLSKTCQNPNDNLAKQCVSAISKQFKFPLRFRKGGRKCVFVWGNQENNFFAAWKKQQEMTDADTFFLPINSQERFVLLTVSPPFNQSDILGIKKKAVPVEAAAPPEATAEIPQVIAPVPEQSFDFPEETVEPVKPTKPEEPVTPEPPIKPEKPIEPEPPIETPVSTAAVLNDNSNPWDEEW
jgi:hypothetical protein